MIVSGGILLAAGASKLADRVGFVQVSSTSACCQRRSADCTAGAYRSWSSAAAGLLLTGIEVPAAAALVVLADALVLEGHWRVWHRVEACLTGGWHSWSPVLLGFVSPGCSPCTLLADELDALLNRAEPPSVLLVSSGDESSNAAWSNSLGLRAPVLLWEHGEHAWLPGAIHAIPGGAGRRRSSALGRTGLLTRAGRTVPGTGGGGRFGRRRARSVSARGIAGLINTMLIRRIGMDSFIERRLGRDTNVFMPDYTGFFEYDPSSDPISEIDFYDGFGGSSGLEGAIVRLDGEYRCTQAEIERIQRQQRRVWRRRTPRRRPSRMEISCP
jgi:hypothetical protein